MENCQAAKYDLSISDEGRSALPSSSLYKSDDPYQDHLPVSSFMVKGDTLKKFHAIIMSVLCGFLEKRYWPMNTLNLKIPVTERYCSGFPTSEMSVEGSFY